MTQTQIYYRLRIRNEADSSDLLVLSSHPGDTNALLCDAPEGDGQNIDPIMGTLEVGSYTWVAIDRYDGGDTYTVTSVLADADARNQLLSHKCVGEYSNDGSSWSALHTGFLNDIKLSDAATYTFSVGDTDRRERDSKLFKVVTEQFPGVSNIIGGPVEAATPVAYQGTPTRAWGPLMDYGPARMTVISNPSGLVDPTNRVTLSLVGANLPPRYLGFQGEWNGKIPNPAEYIDQRTYQYFEADADGLYATTGAQNSQPWGSFPEIEVKIKAVSGGAVTLTFPIAQATRKMSTVIPGWTGPDAPQGDEKALVANSNDWLIIAWDTATMGSQPSNGTLYDVWVRPKVISDNNPLHMGGHPVDLLRRANTELGIADDATSAASTKTALGPLYYELRITGEMDYSEFAEMLKGSAGFATRYTSAGVMEFIPTRATQPSSVGTVTTANALGDDRGEPKDVIFKVSESTAIKGVDFKLRQFRLWNKDQDEGSDRPIDGIVANDLTITGTRRDDSVKGDKIITYDVPGMIYLEGGSLLLNQPFALRQWIQDAGDVIIDRAGWGWIEYEYEVLDTLAGDVGDHHDITLPHQVNAKTGQSPIGQRGGTRKVQIVSATNTPGTKKIKAKDAGNLAQDAPTAGDGGAPLETTLPVPELTLAPSTASPFTIATVTETNVADLQEVNADTQLQYLVQTATPASTDNGTEFGPLLSSTGEDTIDAPAINSGETIWVRGRAFIVGLFGEWSAWISITLGPDDDGTGSELPPFTLALTIDDTGLLGAEATSVDASITTVYFLAGAAGGAAPLYADVLASTTVDSSGPPYTAAALAIMAEGETRTVGAIGEDALGNRTLLVTASITRAVDTGSAAGTPGNIRLTLHAGPPRVFRNVPSALTEPIGMKGWRKSENTGAVLRARLQHNCYSSAGGDEEIHLTYSLDRFATAPIETGVFVRADRERYPEIGDYLEMAADALGDNVTLGVATKGGDGTTTIKTENVYLDMVASATPPDSPIADTPGLPSGGALGNPILYYDAQAEKDDGRVDGTTITALAPIIDRTGITGNGQPYTTSSTQTAPVFHTTGFAGGSLPCWRVDTTKGLFSPLPDNDSCTFIFVVGAITGDGTNGDNSPNFDAPILVAQGANHSNGWVSVHADGTLQCGVNAGPFGNPVRKGTTDVTGATNKHIIRFAWDRASGTWQTYIDGNLELSVTGDPLVGGINTWVGVDRFYYGNVNTTPVLACDYAAVVCYDAPQTTSGLNAAELFLQAIWGTP